MCSNFQMSFLHLVRWLPIVEASGQVDIFDRFLGQADLWKDVPPISEASGQAEIFDRSSGQTDLWSDVPAVSEVLSQVDILSDLWVRLTFGQIYPQAETSCGQVCYYFGQVGLWSDIPPRDEASGQVDIVVKPLGQADLWSDVPPFGEASGWVDFFVRSLSQADLWSDVPSSRDILWPSVLLLWSGWPLVRCSPSPSWLRLLVAKCVTTSVRLTSG